MAALAVFVSTADAKSSQHDIDHCNNEIVRTGEDYLRADIYSCGGKCLSESGSNGIKIWSMNARPRYDTTNVRHWRSLKDPSESRVEF